jgi:hypothetical protein
MCVTCRMWRAMPACRDALKNSVRLRRAAQENANWSGVSARVRSTRGVRLRGRLRLTGATTFARARRASTAASDSASPCASRTRGPADRLPQLAPPPWLLASRRRARRRGGPGRLDGPSLRRDAISPSSECTTMHENGLLFGSPNLRHRRRRQPHAHLRPALSRPPRLAPWLGDARRLCPGTFRLLFSAPRA